MEGLGWTHDGVRITVAPSDHRPVEPTIAFRVTYEGSSVVLAGDTVPCAGVGILILTHYVPGIEPGQEDDWRALAATEFDQQIEVGDDLHRVEVHPGVCAKPAS